MRAPLKTFQRSAMLLQIQPDRKAPVLYDLIIFEDLVFTEA